MGLLGDVQKALMCAADPGDMVEIIFAPVRPGSHPAIEMNREPTPMLRAQGFNPFPLPHGHGAVRNEGEIKARQTGVGQIGSNTEHTGFYRQTSLTPRRA